MNNKQQSQNSQQQSFPATTGNSTGDLLLSRYAECVFWMSRYLERAENLARLLDVTYSFSAASVNEQNWRSVLALHHDEKLFAEHYDTLSAVNVIRFYLTDELHSNSFISCLYHARVNASQLRPAISTEMWVQINTMYNQMRDLAKGTITPENLWHVLSDIRQQCQTFTGITEGGLYRDQSWYFYVIGKQLERADQTTRLLDIKYHLLLPSLQDVGSTIDASQWFALLRAANGYHAFRREYPYAVAPSTVAGFLLLDKRFPRSVRPCMDTVSFALERLYQQSGLGAAKDIIALNETMLVEMRRTPIDTVIAQGLHEYLDKIQLHLIDVSNDIASAFF